MTLQEIVTTPFSILGEMVAKIQKYKRISAAEEKLILIEAISIALSEKSDPSIRAIEKELRKATTDFFGLESEEPKMVNQDFKTRLSQLLNKS